MACGTGRALIAEREPCGSSLPGFATGTTGVGSAGDTGSLGLFLPLSGLLTDVGVTVPTEVPFRATQYPKALMTRTILALHLLAVPPTAVRADRDPT